MPKKRIQSRLVRKQHKQLVRQTVWSSIIGIVLVLAFIFWVLPNSVRLLGLLLDTTLIEETDAIPPQVPILSQPNKATGETPLLVKGFAEPDSQVIFVLNGGQLDPVVVGEEGTFEQSLPLTEGDNIFLAYSKDEAENESRETKLYEVALDTEPPAIALDELADGTQIVGKDNRQLVIQGVTEPQARVHINDRPVLANSQGAFRSSYRLNEGDNELLFKVVDLAGNENELTLTVKFKL